MRNSMILGLVTLSMMTGWPLASAQATEGSPVVVRAEETPATRQMREAKAAHRQRVGLAELTHATQSSLRTWETSTPLQFQGPQLQLTNPRDLRFELLVAPVLPRFRAPEAALLPPGPGPG